MYFTPFSNAAITELEQVIVWMVDDFYSFNSEIFF